MEVGTMLVPIVMPVGVMTLGYAVIRDGPIDCRTRGSALRVIQTDFAGG